MALALAILVAVGVHFRNLLKQSDLSSISFTDRWPYFVPVGLLYLGAHTIWGTYWWILLRNQKIAVTWRRAVRAYFVSQFGKYVPGKVWVLVLRMGLLRDAPGATWKVVGTTGAYETLINMAAGAMLAALLIPKTGIGGEYTSGRGPMLAGIMALPLGLFLLVRLINRITRLKHGPNAEAISNTPLWLLVLGLLQAAIGWCLLALSLRLAMNAIIPATPGWSPELFPTDLTSVTAAYVVGFIIVVAPGGLGPRELILVACLTPQLKALVNGPEGQAVIVALAVRFVWTLFEVVLAGGFYLASKSALTQDGTASTQAIAGERAT
jgi:glycosyltransferase 2 family protein